MLVRAQRSQVQRASQVPRLRSAVDQRFQLESWILLAADPEHQHPNFIAPIPLGQDLREPLVAISEVGPKFHSCHQPPL